MEIPGKDQFENTDFERKDCRKAHRYVACLPMGLALCVAYLIAVNSLWSAPVTSPMAGSYGILLTGDG
jgi:hypothetical protein